MIKLFLLVLTICAGASLKSQVTPLRLQRFIYEDEAIYSHSILFPDLIKKFYSYQNFEPVWVNRGQEPMKASLVNLFMVARQLGLNERDYSFNPGPGTSDSILAEIKFTDVALLFLRDILYGKNAPQVGYNGLDYQPSCFDIPLLLSTYVKADKLDLLLADLDLRNPGYTSFRSRLRRFDSIIHVDGFKDVTVTSTQVSDRNLPLMTRLYQVGILDSIPRQFSEKQLKEKILEAQRLFGLLPDGVLRSNLVIELNKPLQTRIRELQFGINTMRWLRCMLNNEPVIIVNIPSATLLVYEEGKIVLESKIIVGKKSTPTPTLVSKANEVVLYPYWMVPRSIAINELLPVIRRNPGYVNSNNFQILNSIGKVVNPYSINWSAVNQSNFPYTIRQSTGCDNALGLVKLNFYNPYSVYLHDTPTKSLFGAAKRYFSHGCMRVEKAMELAHLLLAGNTIAVDTLEEKGCLINQVPIVVRATKPMNVFVLYNTAWYNSKGELSFSEDIYNKNHFTYLATKN